MTDFAQAQGAAHLGYVATPVATREKAGPWPGVVLIHDILGLGDDMREQADWLAAAGYVTAVPDLFYGKHAIRCVVGALRQLTSQRGPIFEQIEASRRLLAGSAECTGRVGVIGYCMGGAFALLSAAQPGWSAASVNYGMVPENVAEVLEGACPIIAHYGGADRSLPGAADRLRDAAATAGADVDVTEFPGAGHAFINRLTAASPWTPLLKVAGIGYDHDAAAEAKRRILQFFDVHLREPTGWPGAS